MKKKVLPVVLITICAVFTIWIVWSNVTVGASHYTAASSRLPASFDGFRIAVISDLHNAEYGENNSSLISLVKADAPDMIAFTGDLIDSSRTDIDIVKRLLQELVEIAPCYYVSGNHEARVRGPYHELERDLRKMGVVVLHDSADKVVRDGEIIQIAGLDDPDFTDLDASVQTSILAEKLRRMNLAGGYSILLSHRPEAFEAYVSEGIDLALTGHTHGGQFRLPFTGAVFAPNQGFFPKYDAGEFTDGRTTMIISRGVGNSSVPVRLNDRPEVVFVDLVRGDPCV